MSAANTFWRIIGQSSPGPSSEVTPGLMSKSTARSCSQVTPSFSSSRWAWVNNRSQEDCCGDVLSVQFIARAESAIGDS